MRIDKNINPQGSNKGPIYCTSAVVIILGGFRMKYNLEIRVLDSIVSTIPTSQPLLFFIARQYASPTDRC
jgi:hypothetical protein